MNAHIEMWGAVGTVTGSMHVLEFEGFRILLDCGLFQGRRAEARERNAEFPFEPDRLHSCVLSHAHIDHSGNLPTLVKRGFTGTIFATMATRDLCSAMLRDSGKIQEADADWLNRRASKQGRPQNYEPLYTIADAERALYQFHGVPYHRPFHILRQVRCTYLDAGHILGSALCHFELGHGEATRHFVFTGDIGRPGLPILRDPEFPPKADVIVMESTYGNRSHVPVGDTPHQLVDALGPAIARGGKVIIPAFSVGRTQELVYHLRQLWKDRLLPRVPVFVDSPLSANVTEIFRHHPECYDEKTRDILLQESDGENDPFGFESLQYVRDVEKSKSLNSLSIPCIIISASGMAEAGRVLHHLRNAVEDPKNLILITGYMAENTLGRRLAEQAPEVKIFGEVHRRRAEVKVISSLSGHADADGLFGFVREMNRRHPVRQVFLVHGEPRAQEPLAERIRTELGVEATLPERGRPYSL